MNSKVSNCVGTTTYGDDCCAQTPRTELRVEELLEILENQQETLLSAAIEINFRLSEAAANVPHSEVPKSYIERLDRLVDINAVILERMQNFINKF